ncbi:uncharacterized protein LOC130738173 isoform X3 [Lotus japonicus]|uniref:uncharacterized protein LOC130738173 isoform X3 n=1 Tax=Lotus japonicus TaxID=34305 RepID=UPI00258689CE|nr:uncharacterized protein LOC130738173 isoform X3 [Lotus japonicus]
MRQFVPNSDDTDGDDDEMEDCEPGLAVNFKAKHGQHNDYWNLLRNAYLLEKGDKKIDNASALWKKLLENDIFKQKTPMENTVLHVAAENGVEDLVEEIVGEAPDLLTAKSLNGDTALHVAAKAGQFSVVNKLIAAHLKNSSENNINGSQEALKKILEKNNHGHTFFHEAIINGHHAGVMNFLISHDDGGNLKEVAKGAAWAVTGGNEKKSGVYLAIEAGYKDVVHQALTKGIPEEDPEYVPPGKSLLLAAIKKKNKATNMDSIKISCSTTC